MRIYKGFNHQERGCHVYPPANSQIDPAMMYGGVGGGLLSNQREGGSECFVQQIGYIAVSPTFSDKPMS